MKYTLYLPIRRSEIKPLPRWFWKLPEFIRAKYLYRDLLRGIEYVYIDD